MTDLSHQFAPMGEKLSNRRIQAAEHARTSEPEYRSVLDDRCSDRDLTARSRQRQRQSRTIRAVAKCLCRVQGVEALEGCFPREVPILQEVHGGQRHWPAVERVCGRDKML